MIELAVVMSEYCKKRGGRSELLLTRNDLSKSLNSCQAVPTIPLPEAVLSCPLACQQVSHTQSWA